MALVRAAAVIADRGGRSPLEKPGTPLPRSARGEIEFWQAGASQFTWLRPGDWAVLQGGGVWPLMEMDRQAEYEEIPARGPFAAAPGGSGSSASGAVTVSREDLRTVLRNGTFGPDLVAAADRLAFAVRYTAEEAGQ